MRRTDRHVSPFGESRTMALLAVLAWLIVYWALSR